MDRDGGEGTKSQSQMRRKARGEDERLRLHLDHQTPEPERSDNKTSNGEQRHVCLRRRLRWLEGGREEEIQRRIRLREARRDG